MVNHALCSQDCPGPEPTASQDSAAHIRATLATLEDTLEQLNPTLPRLAEAGTADLQDLQHVIQRLLGTLEACRCYWDALYLQEQELNQA